MSTTSSPAKDQPRLRILTLSDKAEVSEMVKDCLLYVDSDYILPFYEHMITQPGSHCYGLMVGKELVSVCWLYTICGGSRFVGGGGRTKRNHQSKGYNSVLIKLAAGDFLKRYPQLVSVVDSTTIPHSALRERNFRLYRSPGRKRLLTIPRYMLYGTLLKSSAEQFRREVTTGSPVKRLMDRNSVIELICSTKPTSLDHIFGRLDEPLSWNGQACFRLPFDVGAAMERFGACLVKYSSSGQIVAAALITRYLFEKSIACCSFSFYGAVQFVDEFLAETFCLTTEEFPDKVYRFFLYVGYDAAQAERIALGCVEKCPSLRLDQDRRGNVDVTTEVALEHSKLV